MGQLVKPGLVRQGIDRVMGRDFSALRLVRALGLVIATAFFAPAALLGGQEPGGTWSPTRTAGNCRNQPFDSASERHPAE